MRTKAKYSAVLADGDDDDDETGNKDECAAGGASGISASMAVTAARRVCGAGRCNHASIRAMQSTADQAPMKRTGDGGGGGNDDDDDDDDAKNRADEDTITLAGEGSAEMGDVDTDLGFSEKDGIAELS